MTLDTLRQEAQDAYETIQEQAQSVGRDIKVYLHWTAGTYHTAYDDYHLCIDGDGALIHTKPLTETPNATYRRNTGSIALALCCAKGAVCYDNGTAELGDYPPTEAQIESTAQVMTVLSETLHIPLDIIHFMTHGEAANNADGLCAHQPYGYGNGCERWDLDVLNDSQTVGEGGQTLRGKAIWYAERGI